MEYFDEEIFPLEFKDAIQFLNLDQTTEIIELEDTFHILKITEKNILEPLSEDEIKQELISELKLNESYALLQDDLTEIENMITDTRDLDEIAEVLSKTINKSKLYSQS